MTDAVLEFTGPLALCGSRTQCVLSHPLASRSGIYLWTVAADAGYLVEYVGEQGSPLRRERKTTSCRPSAATIESARLRGSDRAVRGSFGQASGGIRRVSGLASTSSATLNWRRWSKHTSSRSRCSSPPLIRTDARDNASKVRLPTRFGAPAMVQAPSSHGTCGTGVDVRTRRRYR